MDAVGGNVLRRVCLRFLPTAGIMVAAVGSSPFVGGGCDLCFAFLLATGAGSIEAGIPGTVRGRFAVVVAVVVVGGGGAELLCLRGWLFLFLGWLDEEGLMGPLGFSDA